MKPTNSYMNFNKTSVVDAELIEKTTLWMLRILVTLNGYKHFFEQSGTLFKSDTLAKFLDLEEYVTREPKSENINEALSLLHEKLAYYEKKESFTTHKTLSQNITKLSSLIGLTQYEERILEFAVLFDQYTILYNSIKYLGKNSNHNSIKYELSVILDIPLEEVKKAFERSSKFSKSSLLSLSSYEKSIVNALELESDYFSAHMLTHEGDIEEIIQDTVKECKSSDLTLKDFDHIKSELSLVLHYLQNVFSKNQKGVNILLYGHPGTGKTELSKLIAQEIGAQLFEVSYMDEEGEPLRSHRRLSSYKVAQALLSQKECLMLYDEAEDIFEVNNSPVSPKKQENKAWINRMLETNEIPTIWVTNDVDAIDNAIVRRFDLSIEVPIPRKRKRAQILEKECKHLLKKESLNALSEHSFIAPSLITKAKKVTDSVGIEDKDKVFTQVINGTLLAQGYGKVSRFLSGALPENYRPEYINTCSDLEALCKGIREFQNARLCLYGPSGTGKSAFGKYLADSLDKPLLIKKGSDLMSKWVGETERKISDAFEEALEEDAVLIFDEVDTFLTKRSEARNSWEITQVNEMLLQMENFNGVFIATTNLMESIDTASLRRFDLKLKFDFLRPLQIDALFRSSMALLSLEIQKTDTDKITGLKRVTPGDFALIMRQHRFKPIQNGADFIERLYEEVKIKALDQSSQIGF